MKALIALLCLAGLALAFQSKPVVSSPLSISGRYQIVINPNVRADTFLLDTQTGKTWQQVQFSDLEGQPTIWRHNIRVDNNDELTMWIDGQTLIPKPKPTPSQLVPK